MNKNIFNFIGFDNEFEESQIVLFGAPFDGTTSFRPGTRFAPNIMRNDSFGLETYSPYLDKDMEDYKMFDMGDLDFPFGNPEKVIDMIEEAADEIVSSSKIPFMIGGEHLVTLGSVKSVYKKYPDLHIIHLDAHADLREDYMGQKLSHATVLRRCHDFLGDGKIYQFGIRSGTKEEFHWAKDHVSMNPFNLDGLNEIVEKLKDKPVYITIDLDVLDPSAFPGTGTIEPGGISFKDLIEAFKLFNNLNNIVGMDAVELSPHYDQSGMSTAVACKVIREMALIAVK
ncbi:agmatinase [Acetoanaerobium pronyense]|uniref:Agmatinase n=1 Tax=Acetoanaerobium pronyense TaxID=1482736 RepID=A0ABS4KI69_9FIRM|nr:agmatinase [Acetoanaerobium pronyense]MBP2027468.1 agmatinase [Acetoanaerobium pronyense]